MGLGSKFDRLFETKATLAQVLALSEKIEILNKHFEMNETGLQNLHAVIEKISLDNLKFRDELNAIKALYKIGGTQPVVNRFDGSQPWKR